MSRWLCSYVAQLTTLCSLNHWGFNKRKQSLYSRGINKIDMKIETMGLTLGLTNDLGPWSLQGLPLKLSIPRKKSRLHADHQKHCFGSLIQYCL